MRFDVCTDPDPKEAESLETDLSADSFLFREWLSLTDVATTLIYNNGTHTQTGWLSVFYLHLWTVKF